MLFVLRQLASGGGPSFVLGVKDSSQDSRIVGGMGAVSGKMATEIGGDSLHLDQPCGESFRTTTGGSPSRRTA